MRSRRQRERALKKRLEQLDGWALDFPGAKVTVEGVGIYRDDEDCPDGIGFDLLNGENKLRLFFSIADCLLLEAAVLQAREKHPVFFG